MEILWISLHGELSFALFRDTRPKILLFAQWAPYSAQRTKAWKISCRISCRTEVMTTDHRFADYSSALSRVFLTHAHTHARVFTCRKCFWRNLLRLYRLSRNVPNVKIARMMMLSDRTVGWLNALDANEAHCPWGLFWFDTVFMTRLDDRHV